MEFYGDSRGQEFFPDECFVIPMSTAIARIYTPEGFAVAADGREFDQIVCMVVNDKVQKIFPLYHRYGAISCAIAGLARFSATTGETFSLGSIAMEAARLVHGSEPRNLYEYAALLSTEMLKFIPLFNSSVASAKVPDTQMYLDGFLHRGAERAKIILDHSLGAMPRIFNQDLPSPYRAIHGSQLVYDNLVSMPREKPSTIREAIRLAWIVVRAHCSPEALLLDHHTCEAIGGQIHVATVTAHEGFIWRREPLT